MKKRLHTLFGFVLLGGMCVGALALTLLAAVCTGAYLHLFVDALVLGWQLLP